MTRRAWVITGLMSCLLAAKPHSRDLFNSAHWAETAVEHAALYEQAYGLARLRLDEALQDRRWTAATEQSGTYDALPPAVILDVDETVLSNVPLALKVLAKKRTLADLKMWDAWIEQATAAALPGAREFCQYAAGRKVALFYVTNRPERHCAATEKNLRQQGFPAGAVYCLGAKPEWSFDKTSRRQEIAAGHRILLLIGDDANDFVGGMQAGIVPRRAVAARYNEYWGRRWIVLPNAMYGTWLRALGMP